MPLRTNQNPIRPPQRQLSDRKSTDTGTQTNVSHPKQQASFVGIDPIYTIDNIILSDKTKEELRTVVNSRKNWDKVFIDWGLGDVLKQRKSLFVNLYGAPGTGKTMAAHGIAAAINKKIICVNYADIESKYVGDTSKNLTALFKYAKGNDDIIFFDEADALLSKRVTNMSNSTDVSVNQTRSVLLTLLNDYSGMVIFATNFISNFDAAFMRRIQYHIKFELPNEQMRIRLWNRYIPEKMPAMLDVERISREYDNLSGSDISTAVLRAALKAANNDDEVIPYEYFEEAVKSILVSKSENAGGNVTVQTRQVSEEYALKQLGKPPDDKFGVGKCTGT